MSILPDDWRHCDHTEECECEYFDWCQNKHPLILPQDIPSGAEITVVDLDQNPMWGEVTEETTSSLVVLQAGEWKMVLPVSKLYHVCTISPV